MSQQVVLEIKPEVEQRLLSLPTATTPGERRLALYYTATRWDGQANVFENGPLLGGSTRALGMGMLYNENRAKGVGLYTYDWFSLNQPLDLADGTFEQLVALKLLTKREVDAAHTRGSFLPLFRSLHREEDYWSLINPRVGYLPGHRAEKEGPDGAAIFQPTDREFNLAFVDGCKSWYGTKYWFRELVPHLLPNTDIMFQDFGHYTCFWLPMLVGTFRSCFELQAYVDHTYIWRLTRVPSQAEVEVDFPDEPTCLDKESYEKVFQGLYQEAFERVDHYYTLAVQMQRAAAYAYIGLKDESREILDKLLMIADYLPYREYIKRARVSPAYTPEGRIEL